MRLPLLTAFGGAALLLLLVTLSCRTMPMPSYPPLVAAYDLTATRAAILQGMQRYGWQVSREGPGQIDAALHVRTHFLLIRISYDEEHIRTDYLDSRNLMCTQREDSCSRIHGAYDRWMRNLRRSITSAVSYSPPPADEPTGDPVPL
jgi:hypothetical protein